MFNNFFPPNRALYEIMSKNVVEPERPQMTVWRLVACWIMKATRTETHVRPLSPTHTHTEMCFNPLYFSTAAVVS
jgi:hypothetical protein